MKRFFLLALLTLGGCSSLVQNRIEHLATGRIASDFDTYTIRRVGLLPISARGMGREHAELLQSAFFSELSQKTPFEIVPLSATDLEEIDLSETYIKGTYDPEMVIGMARRFRFDAMLVGTVVDYQFYMPQRISIEMELVAAETGAAIWTSAIQLNASSKRVRESLRAFYEGGGAGYSDDDGAWEMALISPRQFAQFAAWQVARLL